MEEARQGHGVPEVCSPLLSQWHSEVTSLDSTSVVRRLGTGFCAWISQQWPCGHDLQPLPLAMGSVLLAVSTHSIWGTKALAW